MTRRIVWTAVLLLTLLTILATWLMLHIEHVPVQREEPPQSEARRNPYLALERLTARLGGRITRSSDARLLDRLPAGGTVFLEHQRAHRLPGERLRRLLDWVDRGGYLIVVAERPELADPLLDSLGIVRRRPSETNRGSAPTTIEVAVPDVSRRLTVASVRGALESPAQRAVWSAGAPGGEAQMLHLAWGRGHLTIAVDLDGLWSNPHIGRHDHAELYWSLLTRYDDATSPRVLLLSHLQIPGLAEWIWENAWAASVAAATWLICGLWRIVPRFGPRQAPTPPDRRELREHLTAIGRYLWRAGHLSELLVPARAHFHRRLAQSQPAVAALPTAAQAAALAALTHQSATPIANALEAPADTPHAFTETLRMLQALERDFGRARPRKERADATMRDEHPGDPIAAHRRSART